MGVMRLTSGAEEAAWKLSWLHPSQGWRGGWDGAGVREGGCGLGEALGGDWIKYCWAVRLGLGSRGRLSVARVPSIS